MYVGTEMVLPNYLPTILGKTTTLRDSALAVSITVFWASMTIGRLCMTFIIDRIGYSKLFVICCFGQLFSFGLFARSEEHTSELQSRGHLVCRLLLEKKKNIMCQSYTC